VISDGQGGTMTGSSPSTAVFPLSVTFHQCFILHSFIHSSVHHRRSITLARDSSAQLLTP